MRASAVPGGCLEVRRLAGTGESTHHTSGWMSTNGSTKEGLGVRYKMLPICFPRASA